MKHEPKVTANAMGIVAGAWYILCVLWVLISKGSYMGAMSTWFHGVDYSALPTTDLTMSSVLAGFVSFVVFAWISGYLFALAYNKFQ